ncbi:MAG: hypothetical protein DMF91_01460 [Acidobacteria bacterium]|nr:MAG: hypothetical protein DMF91_01460 [Acidobacteriota bacterium]
MKRIAWLCLVVAVAVRSGGLSAQSKPPDFSGTWVQNMEKSSIPAGSSLQAFTNEIEQTGDTLKVVTILRRAGQDTRSERTFVIGKEEDVAGPGDIAITTRVRWEGPVLVFEAINPFMKDSDLRETWTLSADGKVLTKVRRFPTPQGNQTQTFVLEKR